MKNLKIGEITAGYWDPCDHLRGLLKAPQATEGDRPFHISLSVDMRLVSVHISLSKEKGEKSVFLW